jgi:hypothetical protein
MPLGMDSCPSPSRAPGAARSGRTRAAVNDVEESMCSTIDAVSSETTTVDGWLARV